MNPLSEQEEFEFRLRAEQEAQSNTKKPQHPKGDYPGENLVKSAVGPMYEPMKAIGKGYVGIRDAVTQPLADAVPDVSTRLPMPTRPFLPQELLTPSQNYPLQMQDVSGKQVAKDLGGMAFDQVATLGLAKGIPAFAKGADKLATSTFRRIGGLTSGDIKSTRALTAEHGPSFVFNKTKAKPEYVGREILPKASKAIKSNIRAMEPSALKEAGVPEKSIKFSQKVKGLTGIKELPTKEAGDEFFQKVVNEIPDDVQIRPDNLKKALQRSIAEVESGAGRDPRIVKPMRDMLRELETQDMDINTVTNRPAVMDKSKYIATRRNLNSLFGGDEEMNRFIQPLKEAMDKDASLASADTGKSAPMGRARTMYRLPRELQKAETYVNKPNFDEALESELRQASNPEKVSLRETIKGLAGKESDPILKDLEAQRLAKEYYGGGETSGINLGRNTMYEAFKNLARKIPRTYEEGRANVFSALKGKK